MSLCEGILQVIEGEKEKQAFTRVKNVCLEIGVLAGVEIESLIFSFDAVTRGSVAEGAKLKIVKLPGQAWCMQCSQQVDIEQRFDQCSNCESYQLQVTSGEEMRIKELEVE